MKRLYLATTQDMFELPIAVGDTPEDLAKQIGATPGTILSVISHAKRHKWTTMYHRIYYTDKEWNDDIT